MQFWLPGAADLVICTVVKCLEIVLRGTYSDMQAAGNRGYGDGPVYVRTCGPRHSTRKATARLPTDDLDPRHNVLVTIVGNRSSHPPRASVKRSGD
jgi:hypothetical protein